jgi:DNA-binding NtrC family response regulator
MAFGKILIVDPSLIIRKTLETQFRKRRYKVACAVTLIEAEKTLMNDCFDVVFLDIHLIKGFDKHQAHQIIQKAERALVIIMTDDTHALAELDEMKVGAFDCITKPFSIEEVESVLEKAESYNKLLLTPAVSAKCITPRYILTHTSSVMQNLQNLIQKVAVTEATVLITGESGTGKEVVANEIHRYSSLAEKPFIKVNCAAIPESLIESEFFGHEKGAFTGALQRREGRFEQAHNGTLLLDEIGEVPLHLQSKLLRVLQEKTFERVGGNKTITVNVRIIATTNRNLSEAVKSNLFREDLFYRLNVFPIKVPALRDHKEDIPVLAKAFLERFTQQHAIQLLGFSQSALDALLNHHWPGNIRELQNTIERAVILTEQGSLIDAEVLGLPSPSEADLSFSCIEKNAIFPNTDILSRT